MACEMCEIFYKSLRYKGWACEICCEFPVSKSRVANRRQLICGISQANSQEFHKLLTGLLTGGGRNF